MPVCLSSEGSLWTATRALGSGGGKAAAVGTENYCSPGKGWHPRRYAHPRASLAFFARVRISFFFMTAPYQLPSFVHSLSLVVSRCNPCRMSE
jgi:hypothetical protein